MPGNVESICKYIYKKNLKELYVFNSGLLNFCETRNNSIHTPPKCQETPTKSSK